MQHSNSSSVRSCRPCAAERPARGKRRRRGLHPPCMQHKSTPPSKSVPVGCWAMARDRNHGCACRDKARPGLRRRRAGSRATRICGRLCRAHGPRHAARGTRGIGMTRNNPRLSRSPTQERAGRTRLRRGCPCSPVAPATSGAPPAPLARAAYPSAAPTRPAAPAPAPPTPSASFTPPRPFAVNGHGRGDSPSHSMGKANSLVHSPPPSPPQPSCSVTSMRTPFPT